MNARHLPYILFLFGLLPAACHRKPAAGTDTDTAQTDFDDVSTNGISNISAAIHPNVHTVIIVRWHQDVPVDTVSVRFSFENDEWLETPARPGTEGDHAEVLLGIPAETQVQFYFEQRRATADAGVSDKDGGLPDAGEAAPTIYYSVTGELPSNLPLPTVLSYDREAADPAQWILGSVENTPTVDGYYMGPFWIYIIDRAGRIVWYYGDPADNPCMAFPRVAPDNSHLYLAKRQFFNNPSYKPRVLEITLDYNQQRETLVPNLDDCIDVTDDGGILYNSWTRGDTDALYELSPDGTTREIWNCTKWAFASGAAAINRHFCYSNTVDWNPIGNTVTLSFPYIDTAVEIDRATGELIGQWGAVSGSAAFSPSTWEFQFNHFANITPDGTLLISTHAPGHEATEVPGEHRFVEFEIDRENNRLTEKWVYGEGVGDWPMYKGEAHRTENGNTLLNYGTGGIIREVTPAGETAWHVKWDADFSDDRFNKMVGHTVLLDDLYPLCEGFE